jgi:putative ABC transport system permease protein
MMGNLKLSFFLAYKSIIKGNRWTLLMIILVMSLSFANLILIPSLLSGVTDAINRQQIDTVYSNIVISPNPDKTYLDHVSQIENKLFQQSGVIGVSAHLNSGAFFEYNWTGKTSPQDKSQTGNWNVIGIDPAQEIKVTTIHSSLIAGSYLEPGDRDKILLGIEIAGGEEAATLSRLTLGGAGVGDNVRLSYPNNVQREYIIKGIFKARSLSANNLAFVSRNEMASVINTAMDLSVFADRASQILVRTQPGVDENQLITEIKNLGIDADIRSWRDFSENMGGIVSSFDIMGSLIGSIGLLVAGIVMFIVIYINVVHKKRQIGILRAIGITRSVVYGSYLIQSFLFAILGIVIGGLLFGYGVMPYFKNYPIDLSIGLVSLVIDPVNVRNSVIGILLAAGLAGVIPVVNIVRQSIIKAIWGN